MNAADVMGMSAPAPAMNQNLSQHQFHPVRDASAANFATKAPGMVSKAGGLASRFLGGGAGAAEAGGAAAGLGEVAELAPLLLL